MLLLQRHSFYITFPLITEAIDDQKTRRSTNEEREKKNHPQEQAHFLNPSLGLGHFLW